MEIDNNYEKSRYEIENGKNNRTTDNINDKIFHI